jgi:hypothetical protein
MLEAEHVALVPPLLEKVSNTEVRAALELWRKLRERFPFVVIGAQLEMVDSGAIGGFAANWPRAVRLFRYIRERFDELADDQEQDFSSVVFFALEPERQAEIATLVAQTRQP